MRRTPTTWYQLRWPRQVTADQLHAALAALTTVVGTPCVIEATSADTEIVHRLGLFGQDHSGLLTQLRDAVPGLALLPMQRVPLSIDRALKVRFSTPARALRTDDPERVARSVLTALADVGRDEALTLQWVLGRPLIPTTVPNDARLTGSATKALTAAVISPGKPLDNEARSALRLKRSEPGWRVLGRLGVRAATAGRQRQLAARLAGALRTAESPGLRFQTRPINPTAVAYATTACRFPTRLNLSELVVVGGWPIGTTSTLSVASAGSLALPPSRRIPKVGRVLGVATLPGRERPVALTPTDSLRHLEVLGPTGTGKSTLLVNLIVQDMERHRGVLVLDPKGDLITDVLDRVPEHRAGDVVILDPTDNEPVGLNPLALDGRSPELVADQLLSNIHHRYAAHWGPRTQDILHAGLLALARFPGATLVALPLLYSDADFRRRVLAGIDDPIALGPFFAAYEQWNEAERAAAIAPVMNKLRPYLLRPQLRAVIGQSSPRFHINQLFTERKIVLVNLAKGLLGPDCSGLLGSLVLSMFWQATLGRAAIPQARRHPVFAYLDEFGDYLQLGTDLGDALGQARGLGVGLVLAHQFLHQLDPSVRSAVLNNARSRVCFQLATEDARVMAAGSDQPAPEDFTSLPVFECYLQLVAGGAVQPWCSAATLPAPEPDGQGVAIRAASSHNYGIPATETEAALRQLVLGRGHHGSHDLTPRRRGGRP